MSMIARIRAWLARPLSQKVSAVTRRARSLGYKLWCKALGYDFDAMVPRAELDGAKAESRAEATSYQAYPVRETLALVERARQRRDNCSCFVDVGCGKGKQCYYVAKSFDFDRIIGVDFSPSLIAIANSNLRISRQRNVEFEVADAREWRLPDERCVVFFYNPFGEGVMRSFLANNMGHFRKHESIIAYGNDLLRDLIVGMGFEQIHRSAELNNSLFVLAKGDSA